MIPATLPLNDAALPEGVTLIGKSGKFNKSKYTVAGGSVGLFEGKRIGRAKNLEALVKVIKLIDIDLNERRKHAAELQLKINTLKGSNKTVEIKQKQQEINLLNKELITAQTRARAIRKALLPTARTARKPLL